MISLISSPRHSTFTTDFSVGERRERSILKYIELVLGTLHKGQKGLVLLDGNLAWAELCQEQQRT